jgi:hypothetical protein
MLGLKEFLNVTLTQAHWISTYFVCQETLGSPDVLYMKIIFLHLHYPSIDAVTISAHLPKKDKAVFSVRK